MCFNPTYLLAHRSCLWPQIKCGTTSFCYERSVANFQMQAVEMTQMPRQDKQPPLMLIPHLDIFCSVAWMCTNKPQGDGSVMHRCAIGPSLSVHLPKRYKAHRQRDAAADSKGDEGADPVSVTLHSGTLAGLIQFGQVKSYRRAAHQQLQLQRRHKGGGSC